MDVHRSAEGYLAYRDAIPKLEESSAAYRSTAKTKHPSLRNLRSSANPYRTSMKESVTLRMFGCEEIHQADRRRYGKLLDTDAVPSEEL